MSQVRSAASGLRRVLPTVATSLGVPGLWRSGDPRLAPACRAVVVLIDGLGATLLARRGGHAPFLRRLMKAEAATTIGCGFPSTTATSMGTFGTGLDAGSHGLVGYEAYDPQADAVFNELSWEDGPDPLTWQPSRTVFESTAAAGITAVRIGPAFFDGSGLTQAALRGGRFIAASSLPDRVDEAIAAIEANPRALIYLYWGDLDKVGHVFGCQSWQWGDELERIDAELARLARRLPADTALHITADHGMVDVPLHARLDLGEDPELASGVRHVAGEPRSPQLHCEPGAVPDVIATWRERLGRDAIVLTREEAIAAGWFGKVRDEVRPRIGDVVTAMVGPTAVTDSRRHRPELLALIGLHGSITDEEVEIPWLIRPAGAASQ
ncbi:alkaline phosphatase family protein [Janibacter sp. GXQ6167]|uniref:alkaline phosphatase family protein n=1 Tax=Janibacter sp. GXQ6167 TaxID=3240791 RepID=UPI003524F957